MSVESLAIALAHSRASGAAKLVLIGIANHDGDGGAWPSVATLARYAHVDERSVQRAIKHLEGLHEIRRHIQRGGDERVPDHRRPNRYEFLLVCPPDCDRTRNHRTRTFKAVEITLDPVDNPFADGVTPVSPGDASVTGGVTPVSPKPSSNPSTKTQERTHVGTRAREAWLEAECLVRRPRGPHELASRQRICKHCLEKEPRQ